METNEDPVGLDRSRIEIRFGDQCPHEPLSFILYFRDSETSDEFFGKIVFEKYEGGFKGLVENSSQFIAGYLAPKETIFVRDALIKHNDGSFRAGEITDFGRWRLGIDEIECKECKVVELSKRAAEHPEVYLEAERAEIADRKVLQKKEKKFELNWK